MRALPVCIVVMLVNAALAGENGGKELKVLPELPPDAKVMSILEKLGDNEYAQLPPARITGEFNALARKFKLHERGPGQRDYCLKMPWAPDRKRAFYAGGNHGAPHKLNDLWEYDLPSNTWVLLSPPDFDGSNRKAHMDQLVFKDGAVKTKSGKLLVGGHTFSGFTYDPELRLLLWYHKRVSPSRLFPKNPEYEKAYFNGPYLWGFDPYARNWQHIRTKPPFARYDPGSAFNYVSKLKKCVWNNNRRSPGLWSYEHASRSWKKMPARGGAGQSPKMSAQIVYDPKRDILIAHGGHSSYTSEFSFANMSWKKTATVDKENKVAPRGADKLSTFAYDAVNGVVLLCDNLGGYIWVYDPDAKKWTRATPKNSKPDARRTAGIKKGRKFTPQGFFDPLRNALVLSGGGRKVWVYRYKRKK
jgi:hypothetical protein